MRWSQYPGLARVRKLAWLHARCGELKNEHLDEVYDLARYLWEQEHPNTVLQMRLRLRLSREEQR